MKKSPLPMILLVSLCISVGCAVSQSSVEYPPISQLLISETPFPEGWEASDPNLDFPPLAPWTGDRGEVEYVDRRYYTPSEHGGSALIRIQRFENSGAAAEEYAQKVEIAFRETDWNTPWTVPKELRFKSAVANQLQYACSREFGQPECAYVAQYRVYVLEFYIEFYDASELQYTDLLPVFQAIDEQMILVLGPGPAK